MKKVIEILEKYVEIALVTLIVEALIYYGLDRLTIWPCAEFEFHICVSIGFFVYALLKDHIRNEREKEKDNFCIAITNI